ncbi:MAG: hypothetical protein WBZ29_16370 [Methanocella sp.]
MMLILTVSGCITSNTNVPTSTPTPTPTATLTPTTTPSPAPTPLAVDNIVGLWGGSYNSTNYSIQIFDDGKLIYNEGGNQAKGGWEKIDEKQYLIGISIYDSVITLNDNMTFKWGDKGIIFTKKT